MRQECSRNPDLVIIERAVQMHAPCCGRCHRNMKTSAITKVSHCGHCVDKKGYGQGRIAKGTCYSGMRASCIRAEMEDDPSAGKGAPG